MLAALFDKFFIKQPRLRRSVTKLVYGSSNNQVSLLGADLLIHSEFENGYLRAYRRARYLSLFRDEAAVLINLASLIEENTTFIDVGANIGMFSCIISRLGQLKPDLSVFAFEVDPKTYGRLRENSVRYGFRAINVGLGDEDKSFTFVRGAVSHVTASLENQSAYNIPGETFTAQCVPLSSFDIPGRSIVLKIDVEGSEYEVLLGGKRLFSEDRVKAVYCDGVSKLADVKKFLLDFGFELLDGRTLAPFAGASNHPLLAVKQKYLRTD